VTHQPGVSYMVVTTAYKPTIRVSPSGAELQVQASQRGNIINVSKSPRVACISWSPTPAR
jgi:hypothetical protein